MVTLFEVRKQKAANARKYSQQELADAVGVCRQKYSYLELHPDEMTYKQLERAAEYLEINPSDIFLGKSVN